MQCSVYESKNFCMIYDIPQLEKNDNDCGQQYFWSNYYVECYKAQYLHYGVIILVECNANILEENLQANRKKLTGNYSLASFNVSAMIATYLLKMEDVILDNFYAYAIRIRRNSFHPLRLIVFDEIFCKMRKVKSMFKIEQRYGPQNFIYIFIVSLYFS